MSTSDEIVDLLQDKSLINKYVNFLTNCIGQGAKTRNKEKIITATCKYWQLQYCLFTIIYNINTTLYTKPGYLYVLCNLYSKILTKDKIESIEQEFFNLIDFGMSPAMAFEAITFSGELN